MWKRLQHIGKEAYKFQFTASYQDLILEFANETQYDKFCFYWDMSSVILWWTKIKIRIKVNDFLIYYELA